MPSVLRVQGHFPGGSAFIVKWEDNLKLEEASEYDFYVFFFSVLFLHAQKRVASVDLLGHGLTGVSAYQRLQVQCGLWKHNRHLRFDRRRLRGCTYCLGHRKTTRNTFEIWLCKHRSAIGFFFLFLSIAQRIGSKPLPLIWKFFRLFVMCEILRWPLTLVSWHFFFGAGATSVFKWFSPSIRGSCWWRRSWRETIDLCKERGCWRGKQPDLKMQGALFFFFFEFCNLKDQSISFLFLCFFFFAQWIDKVKIFLNGLVWWQTWIILFLYRRKEGMESGEKERWKERRRKKKKKKKKIEKPELQWSNGACAHYVMVSKV